MAAENKYILGTRLQGELCETVSNLFHEFTGDERERVFSYEEDANGWKGFEPELWDTVGDVIANSAMMEALSEPEEVEA